MSRLSPGLEVVDQGIDGNARAAEDKRTTDDLRIGADPELSQLGLVDDERHRLTIREPDPAHQCGGIACRATVLALSGPPDARVARDPDADSQTTTVDQACAGGGAAAP